VKYSSYAKIYIYKKIITINCSENRQALSEMQCAVIVSASAVEKKNSINNNIDLAAGTRAKYKSLRNF